MKNELKQLMKSFPEGIDAVIISSDLNRRYFTGMLSSAGTLLVTKEKPYFIIDFRYIEKAKSVITDFDVILQENNIYAQIDEVFAKAGVENVAVEADCITVEEYEKLRSKLPRYAFSNSSDVSDIITELRAVKSQEEIECISKAQAITDKAFLHMLDFIKAGMTELEVTLELEYTMRKLGADGLAFDSIVVSGANSSLPHGVPSEKKIISGDFLTMDFGAAYQGYCSDMTRTVAIGEITEKQQKVYDTVLKAQLMAIEAIKPGVVCSSIDKLSRDYIYAQGYEGCFGHGLGHSLGLNIHENPRLSMLCEEIIKPNQIYTVEPGVYLSGEFGVRIEDMVVVTEDGCKNLTNSEKKLIKL